MMSKQLNKTFRKIRLRPAQQIALSFLALIFAGTILFALPISQASNQANFLDHIFTATSAVCVTGLVTNVTVETYSIFGQSVIILLMQLGGLGLMTIIAIFLLAVGGRLGHSEKLVMQEAVPRNTVSEIGSFIGFILLYTFIFEVIGAVLLSFRFIGDFGFFPGIFKAIFISVSAFCNAGFDIIGSTSLAPYVSDGLVNVVVASLIIMGGLGFSVWFDLTKSANSIIKRKMATRRIFQHMQVHIKLVLYVTAILLVVGSVFLFIVEYNNPATLGNLSFLDKIMASFFQSTTLRTAGFSTIDMAGFKPVSLLLMMGFMFIGGSPGGTAGGIKTTTFAIVVMMVLTELVNREKLVVFKRKVGNDVFRRALAVIMLSFTVVIVGTMVLLVSEEADLLPTLFEAFSAVGTVGLSMGLTTSLTNTGKIVIIILMFIGRIGPVALAYSLRTNKNKRQIDKVEFPSGNIIVG
jgi:trk system potassium uptake protein TrkH